MTQTDRLYTGQRQEAGGALGLYDYRARYYSTLMGRFVSADPVAKDGLNRYWYVLDNPLRLVDPSGLDAAIFCGAGEYCESGSISNFRQWVEAYWSQHEHIFGGMEDYAFGMLTYVLSHGWSAAQTLGAFHVAFLNTAPGGWPSYARKWLASGLGSIESHFWNVEGDALRPIDTLVGFSLGGAVVADLLKRSATHGFYPESAILIQPALHAYLLGIFDVGFGSDLKASDAPGTRIVTVNARDASAFPVYDIGGTVQGAINVITSGCGHCADPDLAYLVTWAAMQPIGNASDAYVVDALGSFGVQASVVYPPPVAVPAPLAGS